EEEWDEDALYRLLGGAHAHRPPARAELSATLRILAAGLPTPRGRRRARAPGYATRRGRRAALLHHDALNRKIRSRKGSRMSAITNGGAIPEVFDFRVVLDPEGHFIGTVHEDIALQ